MARVILRPGDGSIEVNKRTLEEYFPRAYLQSVAKQALTQSGYEGNVDVRVRVHGGGISGQAAAVRHGIARALCDVDPALRPELKRRGMLTRDARVKERRKAGPQEGPQAPAVLQALASARVAERRFFGTDGVRGPVGELLTPDLAVRLGRAAALEAEAERPQVLIVRDTRESGPMLEEALAAGIAAGGGDAMLGGVLPTPAASVLARRLSFDLAAVVSASHNPFADNGIKFFESIAAPSSTKTRELEIEGRMDEETGERIGGVRVLEGAFDDYIRELRTAFQLDLSGMRVALDCANGATHRAAPVIFAALGAEVAADGGRARRPEHQRGLRLDPPRAPDRVGPRIRRGHRLRL